MRIGSFELKRRRKTDRNPTDDPTRLLSTSLGRQTIKGISYTQSLAAEQAMIHPVVFRCIDKIATSVAAVDWYVRKKEGTGRDKALTSKISDVLESPNGYMTAGELRYWLAMTRAVFGRVPFKVGVGTEGKPNALYPLKASFFETVLTDRGLIKHYKYGTASNHEILSTRENATDGTNGQGRMTKSYAWEIIKPNLSGSPTAKGFNTPLDAIGYPAEIIALLLKRAIDSAAGQPNSKYIVGSEKTLTEDQEKFIQDFLEDTTPGGDEGGAVLVISNTKIDVHELDNNLSDIHSKLPMDDMARHIAGSFGIPISLLGLSAQDGAKFAGNYLESRRSFWEDTIIPGYLVPIQQGLSQALCDEGHEIVFDLDTIPALEEVKADRAVKLNKVEFLTEDEKRQMCGFPPLTPEQKAALRAQNASRKPNSQASTEPNNDG